MQCAAAALGQLVAILRQAGVQVGISSPAHFDFGISILRQRTIQRSTAQVDGAAIHHEVRGLVHPVALHIGTGGIENHIFHQHGGAGCGTQLGIRNVEGAQTIHLQPEDFIIRIPGIKFLCTPVNLQCAGTGNFAIHQQATHLTRQGTVVNHRLARHLDAIFDNDLTGIHDRKTPGGCANHSTICTAFHRVGFRVIENDF